MTALTDSSTHINSHPDTPLFPVGRLLATPGAVRVLYKLQRTPSEFICRHLQGDWGELDAADIQANQKALVLGKRLLSSYDIGSNQKLWIITEADRSATTLLLPQEY